MIFVAFIATALIVALAVDVYAHIRKVDEINDILDKCKDQLIEKARTGEPINLKGKEYIIVEKK